MASQISMNDAKLLVFDIYWRLTKFVESGDNRGKQGPVKRSFLPISVKSIGYIAASFLYRCRKKQQLPRLIGQI